MPNLATGAAQNGLLDTAVSKISLSSSEASDAPLPRFNLKKRPATEEVSAPQSRTIRTVNSAFLSGLFADVAQVQSDDEGRTVSPPPTKKSRSTLTRALSRCPKSFGNLESFVAAREIQPHTSAPASTPKRDNSLLDQLHLISSGSSTYSSTETSITKKDIGTLAFPHLPPTVSNTSLTRLMSNPQLFDDEAIKEAYGWFVEMEDGDAAMAQVDPYNRSASSKSLAFTAATAPKATDYDAELEWATAADTVDDVLGDFF